MEKQLVVGLGMITREGINPVQNCERVKPRGGLWTSTLTDKGSAWTEWCECEGVNIPESTWEGVILTPATDARILVINSYEDLATVLFKYGKPGMFGLETHLDFEKLSQDYDAVHLTDDGQGETRMSHPYNLYGWDMESTVWFRWCFEESTEVFSSPANDSFADTCTYSSDCSCDSCTYDDSDDAKMDRDEKTREWVGEMADEQE